MYGTSIFGDIIVSVSKSIYDEKQTFWRLKNIVQSTYIADNIFLT